jgi:hypothetical protein
MNRPRSDIEIGSHNGLTNRWSQPLAAVKSTFDFMKQPSMFTTLAKVYSLRRAGRG